MKAPRFDSENSNFRLTTAEDFNALYKSMYASIFYFARKLTNDISSAEEITADTFLKVWHRKELFDSQEKVRAFLFITAKNACFNYFRSLKREAEIEKDLTAHFNAEEPDRILYEEEMIRATVMQFIYEEIEKLPNKCKEIFKLAFREGLSAQQIAEKLGISVHTVRNQRIHAIKKLRLAIGDKNWMILMMILATKSYHSLAE